MSENNSGRINVMATTGVGAKWQVRALGMEWARTNKHRRFITIIATILMPDYTSRDIPAEHA
jgi:hypothetical protein